MGKLFRVKRINNICIKGYIIYYYFNSIFLRGENTSHVVMLIFRIANMSDYEIEEKYSEILLMGISFRLIVFSKLR